MDLRGSVRICEYMGLASSPDKRADGKTHDHKNTDSTTMHTTMWGDSWAEGNPTVNRE